MALIRILSALLMMALKAVLFMPAHRLLPAKVRYASLGFGSLVATYFAVAILRHVGVEGNDLASFVWAHAIYTALCLLIAGTRSTELSLYMAVSMGIDLVASALGTMGVDLMDPAVRFATLGWEIAATVFAIAKLHVDCDVRDDAGRGKPTDVA